MRTFAIDFESFYSKECEIRTLGPYHYLNDPRCDVYLVSFAADDGFRWVGRPEDFEWGLLDGNFLVAHNLSWDGLVFAHLVQKGVIPKDVKIAGAACTANLACFCGAQRSLKGAAHTLLGVDVSKDERKWMRGKTWADAVAAGKAEDIKAYALRDAEVCLALWDKYSPNWPAHERALARQTMLIGWRGFRVDQHRVDAGITHLERAKFEAQRLIPWADGDSPVLSPKALGEACRKAGINPPPSLSEDDPACGEWERTFGVQYPWVGAMRDYRKANALLEKLKTMGSRVRPSDGCMGFGLKYFGATTGRWSGDAGFNCLSGDHEVLTPEGWVRLDEWNEELSPIMQWEASGRLAFVRAGKVCRAHSGTMVEIDNARIRLRATPDHRIVYLNTKGAITERPAQTLATSRMSRIPTSGVFDEGEVDRSDIELRFLVALAADGHVNQKGQISFGFKKTRKIERLRAILNEIRCPYHETISPLGVTAFYIKEPEKPEWMVKGYSDWLLDLSHRQAVVVLDELRHWDGTSHQNNGAIIFCSVDREQAGWVATLAHLHGRTVSLNHYKRRWDVYFKEQGSESHVTPVRDVREVPYDGKVFCPQVPSGMFIVRYRDRIHVTGNCQNLPRGESYGVDLRACIVPRPGHTIVTCDLAQIEPRCLAWLAGDTAFLHQIAHGTPLYEAHARNTMGWRGGNLKKEDARIYALAKARVLGLGYGCGPEKFRTIAKTMCGLEIGEREAKETVTSFRSSNRAITGLWNRLQTDCRRSRGGSFEIELPSGRNLTYFNVSSNGGWTFQAELGGAVQRFYGGRLAENLVQATARDVFAEGLLRVERAGFQILFHCHDEVVCEVPSDSADQAATEIARLMTTVPDWMPGIPLEAETQVSNRYLK